MSIFKCKMCGAALEIQNNATVAECEYCGTQQTLPKLDDEKRANMYDRANHFRRNNEFDKAMGIYEQILNEDNTDAEAYWSLVLCRYGIEYVEDPATRKRVPTVNRAQFTSIFDDDNYKSALNNADSYQKAIYEKEANAINEIQKGILAISQKEEPFDVFICYKETDNNGRRTPDSVLANDLYHQLTQEGFKVFFSRITLEDKLGTAYEPYIFAALNSAKVMVALGTKPEYFNAVWVKNEWSRYLSLIKNGAKKMLIPAYKDMDPYDLPEEFSHLQAQDMSKLGFMQDLIRGIKKVIENDASKVTTEGTAVVDPNRVSVLLERVFLFLEDEKWQDANIYCEKVLDIDPKNAEAYLGKLMIELQVKNRKQLADCTKSFDNNGNYSKIMRFGDISLQKEMNDYITCVKAKEEADRLEEERKAEEERIAAEERHVLAEKRRIAVKKRKKAIVVTISIVCACIAFAITFSILLRAMIIPSRKYNDAVALIDKGDILNAYDNLIELGDYKDSKAKASEIFEKYKIEKLKKVDVGERLYLGSYEQDNNTSNGKEDIEWLVLDKKNKKVLIISKYALDCQPYNKPYTYVTWEKCFLRTWLNETFLNNAFSTEEQKKIATTNVSADKNPEYNTNPGKATKDKVFLLSIKEAEKYFTNDESRKCALTAYAKAQKAYTSDKYKTASGKATCWWWLRSPGNTQYLAADVYGDGSVHCSGYTVYDTSYDAVRPALWITLDS